MALMNSPIPRAPQPRFYQGSSMRSVRDADRPDRMWSKTKVTSLALEAMMQKLSKLQQDLGRLRRRIVGGGGGAAPVSGMDYKGQWNPSVPYAAKTVVRFTPDGSPAAGTFISSLAVPAGIAPDTGAPYWDSFTDGSPGMFL